jgi:hypothetical protein
VNAVVNADRSTILGGSGIVNDTNSRECHDECDVYHNLRVCGVGVILRDENEHLTVGFEPTVFCLPDVGASDELTVGCNDNGADQPSIGPGAFLTQHS